MRPRPFCAMILLLLPGCAAGPNQSHSALLGAEPQPPSQQECVLVEQPAVLPGVDELLGDGPLSIPEAGGALVELMFDSLGSRTRAHMLRTNWPQDVQSRVVAAVTSHLSPRATTDWGVLLDLTGGDSPTVQVGRMEYCPCALLNRSEITRRLQRAGQQLVRAGLGRPGTRHLVSVDVRTDSMGNVVERRVGQIGEDRRVNEAILEVVSHMQIAPPLLNRRPQNAWSRIPLTLVFPAAEKVGTSGAGRPGT